jgi:shikimate O-hydroxycinnamoyltransferase
VDSVHSVVGEPLTRIKLTQTPRGSVLGLSISHALVDGFSLFHFLGSWSRVFQGQRTLAPSCERELLRSGGLDDREPVTAEQVLARCGLFWAGKRLPVSRDRLREEIFRVSKQALDELLAEAGQDSGVALSHNDVLTAYLWKKYVSQWDTGGGGNSITYATCPVDFRRILRTVPRTYFGNALCFAVASIDYERLARASLGSLALLVHQAVAQARQDYVSRSLRTLERLRRERGLAVLEEIHVVPPQQGILVTNISRLPLQSLDFGAGLPTAYRALSSTGRAAVILPAEDGVEVRVFHPLARTQRQERAARSRAASGTPPLPPSG